MFLPLTILVHSMLSIYQTTQFNNDVYHSGLCNTAKNILWRTPKWALLWSSIFVCFWPENTHSSSFFTLNLNFFLWYSVCASFKTKIMVGLTIFILEREKITFFQWFWPHQFSPWPQNGPFRSQGENLWGAKSLKNGYFVLFQDKNIEHNQA